MTQRLRFKSSHPVELWQIKLGGLCRAGRVQNHKFVIGLPIGVARKVQKNQNKLF